MKKLLFILVLGLVFSACSNLKVSTNMDTSLPFDSYKTYSYHGWSDKSSPIDPYNRRLIELAFASEFKARGMEYDPSGEGDIVIGLFLVIDKETTKTYYNDYYRASPYSPSWGWGYGTPYGYGYGGTTYTESDYYTGTLVCDIWDKEKKVLAWQGVASKALDIKNKDRERTIPLIIGRLMQKYPVEKLNNQ